ncbi:MAG: FixH family protein [Hyphomonadaceae bacterium]
MTRAFEIRGRHVLAGLLAFFGAVIAVNVGFAVLAVQSFPGEDVRRSYTQGLEYNQTLEQRREQAALGWQASAELRSDAAGPLLEVVLHARDGAPLEGAALEGELQWPTTSVHDRTLEFTPTGQGRYVARLDALQNGRWRLRAHAARADGALDFESELTWRASR